MKMKFDHVLQFKVTLKGIRPPIWRRIVVPCDYTFWDLHVAIQDAMGWSDYHLHAFTTKAFGTGMKLMIGIPLDDEFFEEEPILPGWEIPVASHLTLAHRRATYEYDFGDGWTHQVVLEKILPRLKDEEYPQCTAGRRACPPEDCGGVWGYGELLEGLADPTHPEHAEAVQVLGPDFDPDRFDRKEILFDDPQERWLLAFEEIDPAGLPEDRDLPPGQERSEEFEEEFARDQDEVLREALGGKEGETPGRGAGARVSRRAGDGAGWSGTAPHLRVIQGGRDVAESPGGSPLQATVLPGGNVESGTGRGWEQAVPELAASARELLAMARTRNRRFPMVTIIIYGPDDRRATKVAAGLVAREGDEVGPLERWYATDRDIRADEGAMRGVLEFAQRHRARSVLLSDRIWGCPHEEGIDYPEGESCPRCPFWQGRDRWSLDPRP